MEGGGVQKHEVTGALQLKLNHLTLVWRENQAFLERWLLDELRCAPQEKWVSHAHRATTCTAGEEKRKKKKKHKHSHTEEANSKSLFSWELQVKKKLNNNKKGGKNIFSVPASDTWHHAVVHSSLQLHTLTVSEQRSLSHLRFIYLWSTNNFQHHHHHHHRAASERFSCSWISVWSPVHVFRRWMKVGGRPADDTALGFLQRVVHWTIRHQQF